jgi:hypothetical protein
MHVLALCSLLWGLIGNPTGLSHARLNHGETGSRTPLERLTNCLDSLCSGSPVDLKQRFGPPLSSKTEDYVNPHDQSLDKILTFTYASVSVRLYHDVQTSRYLPISLELRDNGWFKPIGLAISMREPDVIKLLGKPNKTEMLASQGKSISYVVGGDSERTIVIWFTNKHLSKVEYFPYID